MIGSVMFAIINGAGRRDDGFTLLELTMALMIAVILMVGVTGTLRAALAGSRSNRFRQEATSLAMEHFEYARSLAWDNLAMEEIDPSAPLIDTESRLLLAAATGLAADEELLVCDTGYLPPRTMTTVEDVTFTAWNYVTRVNPSLRRVVVLVEWAIDGRAFSHRSDSVVSIVSAGGITAVDQPLFPEAAIVATGNVTLSPGSTASNPPTAHSASIWLNQSFSNLDAVVDGDIVAGGVVNATPTNVYGKIEQNAGTPVNTPDVTDIEMWRTTLSAQAQAGSSFLGNRVVADTTITAPYYVDGALDFEGTVHIAGSGPVFATGTIRLRADSLVTADGVHLVSDSFVTFESGSEFRVSEASAAGVVSFAAGETALTLEGGDPGTIQGIAYAPYGGIRLTGADSWHGALVAHGGGALGQVYMPSGARIEYPANLLPTSSLLNPLRPAPAPIVCG